MTVLTDTQVVTASGGLVELGYAQITGGYTTTTTNAGNTTTFVGPVTIVSDGSPLEVEFFCPSAVNAAAGSSQVIVNLVVDGAVQGYLAANYSGFANTSQAIALSGHRRITLSAGSHTIGVSAWHGGAAGSLNAGSGSGTDWSPTFLRVSKIVQATQWPAVTTGTIICTSSTRPASPFVGQQIYETDTSREFTYVGTQWVPRDGIFTTEALRDAAIPSPFEGQRAYITATTIATAAGQITAIPTGVQTIYNGSVWVCVTQVGATTNTSCSTTTTASYADPSTAGGTNPTVTLVTGTTATVDLTSTVYSASGGVYSNVSFAVSGATTLAGSDATSYYYSGLGGIQADIVLSKRIIITGLTAGTNTFTMKYKTSSGTSAYAYRTITVQGIA